MALLDRRLFGLIGFVAVGIVLPSLPACTEQKSGIMLAIATDMRAPKDVNAVGVTIKTDGKVRFNVVGRVTPQGEVLLPATLAIAEPDDPKATVEIRIIAFQEKKARVMRDIRTSIPKGGRLALLRVPLNFANDGSVTGELPDGILPTATTTQSLDGSTLFPRDVGPGEYDPTVFAPNCADASQTWVAGQCVDAAVEWSSLPDYTPAAIGRADDSATCFEIDGCFRGAQEIPESGDTGVTLDRASCSLLLHGADPSQLNVALVTAETGWCLVPGKCYVPLDHGAAGWTESNGRVQLPAYVCQRTPKDASLALAPKACAAKTESRSVCATTAEETDGGTLARGLVSAEDFATSLLIDAAGKTLYSAGSARVARIDLATSTATELAPSPGKRPWRLGAAVVGPLLTDGTPVGRVFPVGAASSTVTLPGPGTDAADSPFGHLWAAGALALSGDSGSATVFATTQVIGPTALVRSGARFFVGTGGGEALSCAIVDAVSAPNCYSAGQIAQKPIDGIAVDPTSRDLGAWALATDGLYYLQTDTTAGKLTSEAIFPAPIASVDDGSIRLRRGLAAAGHCAIYSDQGAVHWMVSDGGGKAHGKSIAPASLAKPILGVAVDATSVYYTVYAAADDGGGVFRAALPPECLTP